MSFNYMVIKTPYPPEGLDDPLELDCDPAFKAADYRRVAETLFSGVEWQGEEGRADSSAGSVGLQSTDAGLFISSMGTDLSPDRARALAVRALELGAVLMDADSAEIVSPHFEP